MDKGFTAFNTRLLTQLQMYLLTALLALSVLPHFWNLNVYVSLFFSAVLFMRIIVTAYSIDKLPRWLIFLFLISGLALVVVQYSGTIGKDFGVSLLVAMLGLKMLEIKNYRDAYVLLFLTGFMLITQFLYNQEIIFTLYIFAITFLILIFLIWLNEKTSSPDFLTYIKTIGKLSLQALPIMIVMFVFFPRLSGPLWGFDTESASAVTGISGNITPGSISRLSQSSATAFRVKFDTPEDMPENALRYWRGPVITQTDGINWNANKQTKPAEINYQSVGQPVSYQLTTEASRQNWVFALDMPGVIPDKTYVTAEYSVRSQQKIIKRTTFSLISYPLYIASNARPAELKAALSLPDNITPRMRELVKQFQSQTSTEETFISAVLDHFNRENFIYTLSPPLMTTNPADEFLFENRKGFCEHYATSFVLLMRLAGIPARVVAGYQGGEWNPAGEHLIVRQSDAHAWTEVWLKDKGWVRFDPTAAVAPERIELSIDPNVFSEGAPVVFKLASDNVLSNMFKQAIWLADSLDLNWHRWIVGFSQQRQQFFLSSAGLDFLKNYKRLGLAAILLALVIVSILALSMMRKKTTVAEPAKIYWDRFCRKLIKKGVHCHTTDGPQTIAAKASETLPGQSASIQLITDLYVSIRYAGKTNTDKLNTLRRLISQFH